MCPFPLNTMSRGIGRERGRKGEGEWEGKGKRGEGNENIFLRYSILC